MKGIQLDAQSLLYEALKEFTYSFVDNNEPKLWSGARIWAAPIDADDDLAITKTSSPRVGESVELEDFCAIADVDDDAKSQNSCSTNIEDSPMVEQHLFEQTVRNISDLVYTALTYTYRTAVGNVGLSRIDTIGRT